MIDQEIRYLAATEVRAMGATAGGSLRIAGYAAVFNTLADLPGFREQIKPGAFTRSLRDKQDVVCLFNHNPNFVLGRSSAGTLRMKEDDKGLFYECDLPNTSFARDLHESISRGDIKGCSFAFNVAPEGQKWSEGRLAEGDFFVQRDLLDLNMQDVSPVTFPVYAGTDIAARASEMVPMELRMSVDAKNLVTMTGERVPEAVPEDMRAGWLETYNAAYKRAMSNGKGNRKAAKKAMRKANAMMDERSIVPPSTEKRPYDNVSEVPASVPKKARKQWMEVWNSAYKKALGDGKDQKDAESSAFAQANGVIKNRSERGGPGVGGEGTGVGVDDYDINPVDCPASWTEEMKVAYCAGFKAAWTKAREAGLKGKQALAKALAGAMMGISEMMLLPANTPGKDGGTATAPNTALADTDRDGDGRGKKKDGETRDILLEDDDDYDDIDLVDADKDLTGRKYDEADQHEQHSAAGMCDVPGCVCQNRWAPAPAKAGARSEGEQRDMARTKRVDGKDLTAKSFAFVGDPDKTETWKYPIHDADHVRAALSRWGQHKDIPADKEAGVYRKILAAAKRDDIKVTEKDPVKAARSKDSVWTEVEWSAACMKVHETFDPTL